MTIYFSRHALTKANEAYESGEYFKIVNTPLSEKGIKEAGKLNGDFDMVITSNLKRSYETLNYSQITYNNLIMTPLCREYFNNDISSFLKKEIENAKPFETFTELIERVNKFKVLLGTLNKTYQKILVISHGIFLFYLLGLNKDNRFGNCEMRYCVNINDSPIILTSMWSNKDREKYIRRILITKELRKIGLLPKLDNQLYIRYIESDPSITMNAKGVANQMARKQYLLNYCGINEEMNEMIYPEIWPWLDDEN